MSGSDAAAAVDAGGAGGQARAFILGADLSGVQAAVDRIPEAWRGATTVADLAERLEAYTKDVVAALTGAGARPDVVQIGNEITAGMLTHVPMRTPTAGATAPRPAARASPAAAPTRTGRTWLRC